jgi:uncharacterized membrane protein
VTAEPPPPRRETAGEFDYDRTVALSDGVFAIAMTLLVLSVGATELGAGRHVPFDRVIDRSWSQITSYAISFAVLAFLWARHHAFFRSLRRIDARLTALNLAYLALIAFTPFPTRLLGQYGKHVGAVAAYAITLGCVALLAAAMRAHASRRSLIQPGADLPDPMRSVVTALVFFGSIAVAFLSPILAEATWILVAVLPDRVVAGRRVDADP